MHIDMIGFSQSMVIIKLIKDKAHVGATGLCCAAAAACEGVCSVVYRGEAVALCAGHCGESEGVAVSVHGCEHRVMCSVCCVGVAGMPQGVEDTHQHLCLCDDTMQHALPKLLGIGALADEELVLSGVLCQAVWAVVVALCECEVWVDVVCEIARGFFGKCAI